MLHKPKTQKLTVSKFGLSFPIFLMAFILSSATINKNVIAAHLPTSIKLKYKVVSIDKTNYKSLEVTKQFKLDTIIDADELIYTNVEVLPSFDGTKDNFAKFLATNLRYPPIARDNNIQGRVFCKFIVEKDGSLTNFEVIKGIGGGCDEEAIRVFKLSPKWNPGLQNGKPVRVSYTIPIFFQLADKKPKDRSKNKKDN